MLPRFQSPLREQKSWLWCGFAQTAGPTRSGFSKAKASGQGPPFIRALLHLLVCGPQQAARTVKDLVALCRANPGKVAFGSAGNGSAQHLALEMFKLAAKVDALHVPYKGSGPMLTDLMGGQIQYSFDTMTAATPHVKSGKIIAIAQTRAKRSAGHPNVPTMVESGFPDYEATTWYGLAGPAHLPAAMVKHINEDLNKVLAQKWQPLIERKPAPADADEWAKKKDKKNLLER